MARLFNGLSGGSLAQATVAAVDTGDWTIFAWINPTSAGVLNVGKILQVDTTGSSIRQRLFFSDSSRHLQAEQSYTGGVSAVSTTSTTVGASAWSLVVATYTDADKKIRIYIGTVSAAVAEASYSPQTAGSGTRLTGGTRASIGNAAAQNTTFDGSLARVGFFNRLLRLDEMEALRLGWVLAKDGTERAYWPFDSPTASQVEDLFGTANATATTLTVSEDPPIPTWQSGEYAVLVSASPPQTISVGQAVETDSAFTVLPMPRQIIGQAIETDTALVITPALHFVVAIGQAVETDTAFAVLPKPRRILGIARETDRALLINPVLPEEPPVPVELTLLVGAGPLGRGEHRVFLYTRGGASFVGEVGFTSLTYSRRLDDKSTAQVSIGAGTKTFLGDLRGWKHELLIARDDEPVWLGPIHEPEWEPSQVTLPADDLLGWFDNRDIAEDLTMNDVDLATVFARLVHDSMAREPSPGLYAAASLSGVVGDRSYVAAQHQAVGDALRSLGQAGVDYTCILRRLYIGALSLLPSITLTDDTLRSPKVKEGKAATKVTLVGSTTSNIGQPIEAVAGGPNVEMGLLEKTINDPDVMTHDGAVHYVRDAYAFLNPAPLYVTGVLAPTAPVDMEHLIPGMHVAAKLSGTDRTVDAVCRLTQVDVTVRPSEQGQTETIAVTLVPVGLEG